MENMEQYIGRKIKGFKFENTNDCLYNPKMNSYIGEVGVIRSRFENMFIVEYETDFWGYPIDLVIAQLKIQGDTKTITKEEATALIESVTGDKY
jgi:hypothetical protein